MVESLNDGAGMDSSKISETTQSAEAIKDTENTGGFDDARQLARRHAVDSERARGVLVMTTILDQTR